MAKRLPILLATIVLGTSLFGSVAYAAVPSSDAMSIAAIPGDTTQVATEDGNRPDRGDREHKHHKRFCVKLNEVLTRLVANGVITREQKDKIMDALNCDRDPRPTTTKPNAAAPTAAER